MPLSLHQIFTSVWSGWLATWPTQLLALIWIGWLVSWTLGSFWSARTEKRPVTWRARACCPGGGLIHMVGADSSWTFLVERDHAKGRPSGHRHRPVCACAPPDLYRTHRCDTGDGCSRRDGDCHSRCGADRLWLVGKSKGGRRLSHLRARPERIRFLPPPGSDADTLPPSPVVAASASGQQSKARRGSRL